MMVPPVADANSAVFWPTRLGVAGPPPPPRVAVGDPIASAVAVPDGLRVTTAPTLVAPNASAEAMAVGDNVILPSALALPSASADPIPVGLSVRPDASTVVPNASTLAIANGAREILPSAAVVPNASAPAIAVGLMVVLAAVYDTEVPPPPLTSSSL